MGHAIRGAVMSRTTAEHLKAELPGVLLAPLRQGFVFVPLTNRMFDLVNGSNPDLSQLSDDPTWKLGSSMERLLSRVSRRGPVAYIETDYSGGVGDQAAMVWAYEKVVVAPRRDEHGPINDALRAIGVRCIGRGDEFDGVGLGQYRGMDGWESEE
jgi:hypothetical protein